jgi:hypothetical protein
MAPVPSPRGTCPHNSRRRYRAPLRAGPTGPGRLGWGRRRGLSCRSGCIFCRQGRHYRCEQGCPRKGKPAARRGRKATGLSPQEAAGLPKRGSPACTGQTIGCPIPSAAGGVKPKGSHERRTAGAPPGSGAFPAPRWGRPPSSRGATPAPCASPARSAAPPPRWAERPSPRPSLGTSEGRAPEARAAGARIARAGSGRPTRASRSAAPGSGGRARRVGPHLRAQPAGRPGRGRRGPGSQVVLAFGTGRGGVGPGRGGLGRGGGQGSLGARPFVRDAVAGRRHPAAALDPSDRARANFGLRGF